MDKFEELLSKLNKKNNYVPLSIGKEIINSLFKAIVYINMNDDVTCLKMPQDYLIEGPFEKGKCNPKFYSILNRCIQVYFNCLREGIINMTFSQALFLYYVGEFSSYEDFELKHIRPMQIKLFKTDLASVLGKLNHKPLLMLDEDTTSIEHYKNFSKLFPLMTDCLGNFLNIILKSRSPNTTNKSGIKKSYIDHAENCAKQQRAKLQLHFELLSAIKTTVPNYGKTGFDVNAIMNLAKDFANSKDALKEDLENNDIPVEMKDLMKSLDESWQDFENKIKDKKMKEESKERDTLTWESIVDDLKKTVKELIIEKCLYGELEFEPHEYYFADEKIIEFRSKMRIMQFKKMEKLIKKMKEKKILTENLKKEEEDYRKNNIKFICDFAT